MFPEKTWNTNDKPPMSSLHRISNGWSSTADLTQWANENVNICANSCWTTSASSWCLSHEYLAFRGRCWKYSMSKHLCKCQALRRNLSSSTHYAILQLMNCLMENVMNNKLSLTFSMLVLSLAWSFWHYVMNDVEWL